MQVSLGKQGWMVFDISTLVGYLMSNPVYTYIKYIWFVNSYFVNKPELFLFFFTQFNDFMYFYLTGIILFKNNNLFAHS